MKTLPFRIAGILFVIIAPLCFVGAIGSALSSPKLYTATTILRISADGNPTPESLQRDLQQTLSSTDSLRAIAEELDLSAVLGAYLNEDKAPLPLPEAISCLRDRLNIEVVNKSQLIFALSFRAEDPGLAADTVNCMATALASGSSSVPTPSGTGRATIEIVDKASPPSKPSSPSIFRTAVYSNAVGLVFLAVGIVLLVLPRRDSGVRR